jgi:hypothetical protein
VTCASLGVSREPNFQGDEAIQASSVFRLMGNVQAQLMRPSNNLISPSLSLFLSQLFSFSLVDIHTCQMGVAECLITESEEGCA